MRRVAVTLLVCATLAGACGEGGDVVATTSPSELPTTTERPATTTSTLGTTTIPTTTTLAQPVSVYGGAVVIADDQEPPTLNPYAPDGDNFIVSIIGQAHLAGAYDIDAATLELIPELVVELPTVRNGGVVVNKDGTMTVRWQVRDEAVWSDGVPISGDDFAFTLEYREAMINCFDEDVRQRLEDLVAPGTMEDVGAKTVALRFDAPSLEYEELFEWIVPKHAVEGTDYCEDWNKVMWPAAGPFVVDDWQRGKSLRLTRNPKYWKVDAETGESLPYLDAVEFRFIWETDAIVRAFKAREVQVIQPPPAPETINRLKALTPEGAEVHVLSGPVWEHINFQFGPNNRNPDSLNRFVEYRQAVAYGLDLRQLFDNIGYPLLQPTYGFIQHFTPSASSEPWLEYDYDPVRARELLAMACDKAGQDCNVSPPVMVFSTTSNADFRPRLADGLVDMLGEIGIEVRLELEDSQLFFGETLDDGDWDVGEWAWVGTPGARGLVNIFGLFDPDVPPTEGANYYRWGTPDSIVRDDAAVEEVRDLLAAIRGSVDHDEILALAGQIEEVLATQVVVIPLNARLAVGAVWADEIAGFQMNSTQAGHTWNIETWRRVDQ